jgi:regulator of sigma E protease
VLIALIASSEGQPLEFLVRRDGEMINFSVTPILQDGRPLIGFTLTSQPPIRRTRIHEGIFGAGEMIAEIATGPIRLLGQFASGEGLAEGEGVVGPIGLGGMVTEAYQVTIQRGFGDMLFTMIFFTGVLNAALGVMNLLPIPALDGARLVFLGIEGVRKKPIPPDKEAFVHMIGLVSLSLLAVFIAYRDILRLIPGLNDYAG